MSQLKNIALEKNHSAKITSTITGLDEWAGIHAKFFLAADRDNVPDITIEGSIENDSTSDRIVIIIPPEATQSLEAGDYFYEITLYTESDTYIKNVNHGVCTITPTISDLL